MPVPRHSQDGFHSLFPAPVQQADGIIRSIVDPDSDRTQVRFYAQHRHAAVMAGENAHHAPLAVMDNGALHLAENLRVKAGMTILYIIDIDPANIFYPPGNGTQPGEFPLSGAF